MKLLSILLLAAAAVLVSQPAPREQVGPLPSGGFLLNSGWRIRPAGNQVPVGTLPMSTAVSPDGKFLLVLNGGYNPPTISVIDVAAEREVGRTPVADGWLGLAFSPKGDFVYVGGGSRASVFEFKFANGVLSPGRSWPVAPEAKRTPQDFIGDVAVSPDGRLVYAADLYRDSVVVINPQSGIVIERFKTARRPYRILFHPDGKSFFVTSWADGSLGHYEAANGALLATVRLAPHATDMVWRAGFAEEVEGDTAVVARIFVSAANSNNVYSVGVTATKELRVLESINLAMTPRHPLGMTPSGLALSPDLKQLYVVCSDANAVAVADLSLDRADVRGFIPTGWYPTAVRALSNGKLAIVNGRGLRSGRTQGGTVGFLPVPNDGQLDAYSTTVIENSPYTDSKLDNAGIPAGGPVPSQPGGRSPIEHVIYILKESRTYDQILGDMKEGNGDASLALFGESVTPNQHKLSREFVLLDNFYVNGDTAADGQSWSTAAIATDYVQKMSPNSDAGRRNAYDYEGQETTVRPGAGYLWSNAAAREITMRNYGHFVNNLPTPGATDAAQISGVRDPILSRVTNPKFRGLDADYPDVERVKVFLKDLADFERAGQMPRLILMRLGGDRTSGTVAGKIAPAAAVADNDYALGMLVEAVSRSRFWGSTAIFVAEADAHNGSDHVDSHRSPAFLVSPHVKRGVVDGTMYNTTSTLRTMELILGLKPMTHFDAGARPMNASFQSTANAAPYTAEKPRIPLDQRNPGQSAAATPVRSILAR